MSRKNYILIIASFLQVALTLLKGQDYQLVWEENFDGTGLDPKIWNVENREGIWNTGNNDELQFYRTGNVSVGDDGQGNNTLIITAKPENFGDYVFTSGRVNTKGKFSFRYGKVEARIKLPDVADGLWPAFWLKGFTELGWPACGETDVMEVGNASGIVNGTQNRYIGSATHWDNNGNYAHTGNKITYDHELNEDYHLYILEWTPQHITTYIDDTQIFQFNILDADKEEYRDYAQYFLLNLAVGGAYTGILDDAGITAPLPAKMYVDYLRVYQDTELQEAIVNTSNHKEIGDFGIFAEKGYFNALNVEFDGFISSKGLELNENETPYEGDFVLSYTTSSENDFFLEINSKSLRNLENYIYGTIDFFIKTDIADPIVLEISDINGNSKSILIDAESSYDFQRVNKWRYVSIPIQDFTGDADFSSVNTMLRISGTAEPNFNLSIDKVMLRQGEEPLGIRDFETKKKEIFVYPNPAFQTLNFYNLNESARVSVIDSAGRNYFSQKLESGEQLDISGLRAGFYVALLQLTYATKTIKFIKH